ncbi:MAG: cytidine deaminase [Verrucomicrobiales bacterium]|nr:cytidine deaminase [Verrucomicrobiales bacterium]
MTTITLPAIESGEACLATGSGKLRVPGYLLEEKSVQVDEQMAEQLVSAARSAADGAYAPFSRFRVGAAVIMKDDPGKRIFAGSNVENSSFGGTICAERAAIVGASAQELRKISLLAVSTPATLEMPLSQRSPCGLCRQVIREFADEDTLIICDSGEEGFLGDVLDIERLLPFGFRFAKQ